MLEPGARDLVPTGVALIACREGYEAQVRPRSGLALEFGVTVLNAPGTIDSDYRGEVKVLLVNLGDASVRDLARHAHRAARGCALARASSSSRRDALDGDRARRGRLRLDGRGEGGAASEGGEE